MPNKFKTPTTETPNGRFPSQAFGSCRFGFVVCLVLVAWNLEFAVP
jgi:hypothetical protein